MAFVSGLKNIILQGFLLHNLLNNIEREHFGNKYKDFTG